jgi:hypothetical protein
VCHRQLLLVIRAELTRTQQERLSDSLLRTIRVAAGKEHAQRSRKEPAEGTRTPQERQPDSLLCTIAAGGKQADFR